MWKVLTLVRAQHHAIALVRIPGVYITSKMFTDTLFPMGLATAAGSLLSVMICLVMYAMLSRKESKTN